MPASPQFRRTSSHSPLIALRTLTHSRDARYLRGQERCQAVDQGDVDENDRQAVIAGFQHRCPQVPLGVEHEKLHDQSRGPEQRDEEAHPPCQWSSARKIISQYDGQNVACRSCNRGEARASFWGEMGRPPLGRRQAAGRCNSFGNQLSHSQSGSGRFFRKLPGLSRLLLSALRGLAMLGMESSISRELLVSQPRRSIRFGKLTPTIRTASAWQLRNVKTIQHQVRRMTE